MEINVPRDARATVLERNPDEEAPSKLKAEIRFNYKKKLEYYGYRDDLMSKHILEYDPLIRP